MNRRRHYSRLLLIALFCMTGMVQAAKPEVVVGIGFTDQINVNHKSSSYHFDVLLSYRLFTELGYQVRFVIAPYAKLTQLLQQRQIDVATRQSGPQISGLLYSPVYLEVRNLVFARKDFAASTLRIEDLRLYSLVAFQNARNVLGSEFNQVTEQALEYQEVFDHLQAVQLLLKGRTDLLVLNKLTFYRRLAELQYAESEVQSFDILPLVQYRFATSNEKLLLKLSQKVQSYLEQDSMREIDLEAFQQPEQVEKLLRMHR